VTQTSHVLKDGNRILVVEEEFLLGNFCPRCLFVGERVSLGENRIETTDESSVSGGVSGKIRKIKMSDSVRETNSGMREGTRKDGEGEREAAIVGNGRIEGYGEPAGAGGAGSDVDEQSLPNSRIVGIPRTPCLTIYALLCKAGISERAIIP